MAKTGSTRAFVRDYVAGAGGWSAVPRLTIWLCLPSLLGGAAAAANLLVRTVLPSDSAARLAVLGAATGIEVVFSFPSFVLTPIAALLALFISIRKRWSLRVIAVLWVVVVIAAGVMIPAFQLAMRDFLVMEGALPESPR
jgi:hypothetical protein